MNLTPPTAPARRAAARRLAPRPAAPAAAGGGSPFSFNKVLRATGATGASGSPSASPNGSPYGKDKARTAAQKLVSSALILPLLKQLRHDPLQTTLFHSGPGGDAFRQRLDTILADRIVQSDHFPLVDQIHKQITNKAAALESAQAKGGKVNLHG